MHKFFSLGILITGILAIYHVKLDTLTGIENYTLLVIGFVILGGILSAEIFAEILKFPKVTGYVFTGALLGPYVFNILSMDAVVEMKMFNSLAVGFIALTAGLELGVKDLTKVFRTILTTTVLKLLTLPLIVGSSLCLALYFFPHYLYSSSSMTGLIALACVFSALSLGTSPAIVIAVASEVDKPGRMKDLILGSAIFKDIVVVVTLAIALAFAKSLVSTSIVESDSVALTLFLEIGTSVLIGCFFGTIAIFYAKYIKARMLLFILLLVLVISELCHFFHAELLLSCIITGFVVRNFSDLEHDLMEPLKLVSLPTFIIFFTIVGASFDLGRAWKILPLGLLIFTARAFCFYLSSRIAVFLSKEENHIKSKLWLGYLPQAGVTLGLVGLASIQLPEYSDFINDLGLTLVGLNLILGPLGLRVSLSSLKDPEISKNETDRINLNKLSKASDISLLDVKNNYILCNRIHEETTKNFSNDFYIWHQRFKRSFEDLLQTNANTFERSRELSKWLNKEKDLLDSSPSVLSYAHSIEKVFDEIRKIPNFSKMILPFDYFQYDKNDGFFVCLQKIFMRIKSFFGIKIFREIDSQYIMLKGFGFQYSEWCCQSAKLYLFTRNTILGQYLKLINSECTTSIEKIDEYVQSFLKQLARDSDAFSTMSLDQIENDSKQFGLPGHNVTRLQRAKESKNQVFMASTFQKFNKLEGKSVKIFRNEFRFLDISLQIRLRLIQMIEISIVEKMDAIIENFANSFELAIEKIKKIEVALESGEKWKNMSSKQSQDDLRKEIKATIDLKASLRIVNKFLADTSAYRLSSQIRRLVDLGDKTYSIFSEIDFDSNYDLDEPLSLSRVNLGELIKKHILDDLLTDVEDILNSYKNSVIGFEEVSFRLESLNDFAVTSDGVSENCEVKRATLESLKISRLFLEEQIQDAAAISKACSEKILLEYKKSISLLFEASQTRNVTKSKKEKIDEINNWAFEKIQGYWIQSVIPKYIAPIQLKLAKYIKKDSHARLINERAKINGESYELSSGIGREVAKKLDFDINAIEQNPLLKKAFTLRPLRDGRLLVGRSTELSALMKSCSKLGREHESSLVIGDPGSGLTSILNLLYQNLEGRSVYRFEADHPRYRGKFMSVVADELACEARTKAIRNKLNESEQIVIVDDLHKWFSASTGLLFLRNLRELINGTIKSTVWIIGTSSYFYDMYKYDSLLGQGFSEYVHLSNLNTISAKEMIEKRFEYCGLSKVDFIGRSKLLKTTSRLGLINSLDFYFSKLTYIATNDLTCMINLWLKSISFTKSTNTLVVKDSIELLDTRNFYSSLSVETQAALHCLLIYGDLRLSDICLFLGVEKKKVEELLYGLNVQKQLVSPRSASTYYYLNPTIRFAVQNYFYGDRNVVA